MIKRTLQEWADFLNMYVFINPDGSVMATEDIPKLQGSYHDEGLRIYWSYPHKSSNTPVPERSVDLSEFPSINIGDSNRYCFYHLGWENSITTPKSK